MKLKMSKEVDLGKEPIGHLLLILALPSITSQVVNALYNMVDRMYIGHIPEIGSAALTGVPICWAWAARRAPASAWDAKTTKAQRRSWETAFPH